MIFIALILGIPLFISFQLKIKFVDIRNRKVIQNLDYKNDNLKYIIKINHPSIGDALLVLTSTNKIELLLPNDK